MLLFSTVYYRLPSLFYIIPELYITNFLTAPERLDDAVVYPKT